jgi:hypothetical protein
LPIKLLTQWLAAVGLGSPPAWLKPYRVLSTGERFRAEVVRAVLRVQGSGFGVQEEPVERPMSKVGSEEDGGEALPSTEYSVLSTRQRLIVIDEFTNSLDRTVAKTASAAVARLLRREVLPGRQDLRLVAVTCHRDILPWLSPDWTVELGELCAERGVGSAKHESIIAPRSALRVPRSRLVRGQPPAPSLDFTIARVPQSLWPRFAEHHYLSGGLAASATCYGAFMKAATTGRGSQDRATQDSIGEATAGDCSPTATTGRTQTATTGRGFGPVAFCAVVAALGWPGVKRIGRLVTLPEFQGLGIGGRLLDGVAQIEAERGQRVTITASHPAIVAHCSHSPRWRYCGVKKTGSTRQRMAGREIRSSLGRAVAAFEFCGQKS